MIAKHAKTLIVAGLATLTLAGCLQSQTARVEIARRIAAPAFMVQRDLQAGDFSLRLYERIHNRGGTANIYIEGDDVTTGIDPTPQTPVSLQLAAHDKAKNVIYIARPCQYKGRHSDYKQTSAEANGCAFEYSTTKRFAPEVIDSFNIALDEIKRRWNITSFNLYGHSGGGAIATILAEDRNDVLSFTTIAGMLDTESYSARLLEKHYSQHEGFEGSINPKDIASKLKNTPQYHYLGSADTVMPPAALHNYLAALGSTNCSQFEIIQENTYTGGWTEKWPELLKNRPTCKGKAKAAFSE